MDHLAEITYSAELQNLCAKIRRAGVNITTYCELEAFLDTRTKHDAQRLANALRELDYRPDLADRLEAIIQATE